MKKSYFIKANHFYTFILNKNYIIHYIICRDFIIRKLVYDINIYQ